jgi:hypothetical protein
MIDENVRVFGRTTATRCLTDDEITVVGGAHGGHGGTHTSCCTQWSSSGCVSSDVDDVTYPHPSGGISGQAIGG